MTAVKVTPDLVTRADVMAIITAMDAARQATEDQRASRRNRNRVLMILVAWLCTLVVPPLADLVIHAPMLAQYAASIGFTGDLVVTGYAWVRHY